VGRSLKVAPSLFPSAYQALIAVARARLVPGARPGRA